VLRANVASVARTANAPVVIKPAKNAPPSAAAIQTTAEDAATVKKKRLAVPFGDRVNKVFQP
jgi:acyl-CoA reductase-like NAD-dependent aldehyde dehydrogenase